MKNIVVLLLVGLCTLFAIAQDAPKAEVFGGYQYTNVDTKGLTNRLSFNGWDADVAGHVSRNFSIVGDVSGAYKSESGVKIKVHNFLFGPRISAQKGKVTPFAEALFGFGHASAGAFGSNAGITGFAMAFGGGLDAHANRNVAIRLLKLDYVMNRFSDSGISQNLNNFRLSTGIVFKF